MSTFNVHWLYLRSEFAGLSGCRDDVWDLGAAEIAHLATPLRLD